MKDLKIIKLGYKVDLNKIHDSYFITEIATIAENKTEARSILLNKINELNQDLIYYTGESITLKNIPLIRAEEYDKVLFEDSEIVRWKIPILIASRERNNKHDEILNNYDIEFCYIIKDGLYYRPKYAGYCDNIKDAGVYSKEAAVDSAKKCEDLIIIPIDINEHNKIIQKEIDKLKSKIIIA